MSLIGFWRDTMQEIQICRECGAMHEQGSCEEIFHWILAMEYDSPRLLAEHFKTVACYTTQHPAAYTPEAIQGLIEALREHLEEGLRVTEIRNRHSRQYEGSRRVYKDQRDIKIELCHWPMTIQDVWQEDDGDAIAQKVVLWAQSIVDHCRSLSSESNADKLS